MSKEIDFYFQQIEDFCIAEEVKGTEFCWEQALFLIRYMDSIMREVNPNCERTQEEGPDFRTRACKAY